MTNELLFFLSALIDICFVFFAARKGVDWLFGSIIANLFLVGIFGAKLLIIFGYATNAGNVFYACVFLATHFLLELYGSKVAKKTIFYGLIFTVFFLIMSQFTFQFSGIKTSESVNNAIYTLFVFSPRIFFASVMAYIFAQNINIFLFEWLKTQTKGKTLWLRSNAANILGQLVDSLIFFSIAFFDSPGQLLVSTIMAGWLVKVLVGFLATPFLYLSARLEKRKI
jgi:uncharacterized integral membrane protein (TIGR00697 family)